MINRRVVTADGRSTMGRLMPQQGVVEQWLVLTREELVEEVHRLVKRHDDHARRCWDQIRDHRVLVPRVRGVLSALERQMAEHRDAAMYGWWIQQARRALEPSDTRPAAAEIPPPDDRPVVDEQAVAPPGSINDGMAAPPAVVFRSASQ